MIFISTPRQMTLVETITIFLLLISNLNSMSKALKVLKECGYGIADNIIRII